MTALFDNSAFVPLRTRVLLVDDQRLIAEALRRMVADQPDIDYRHASDPAGAVQVAADFKPTVILQDIVMPGIDGFEVLQRVRADDVLRQVPVVMLSSQEDPELKARSFALGANDYLVKWPDKRELLARVRHLSGAYLNLQQRDAAYRALHESEAKLALANRELQRMARIKDEFIATVSHELRTPLTSINASLLMLADGMAGELPKDAHTLLGIANQSCDRLVRLINDILDIEKMDAGRMAYAMQMQPLMPLAEKAVHSMREYAAKHAVTLALHSDALPPGSPEIPGGPATFDVTCDADRITQVLINLISNAVKFSPAGAEVQVRLSRLPTGVRIAVADRGEGIPVAFQPRVFERFAQADASDSRRKGGTGLGLSICKRIVDEHGGTLHFDSRTGEGTTFYVDLPA